jgi:dissimilatory sulfite reductase related protein
MEKMVAGKPVQMNEEGFMINLSEWTREIGEAIAAEHNISLTPMHWQVIAYLQSEFRKEVALTIRRIGKSGVVDIKQFYQLFPPAPLKIAAKISGIPKPASCI